MQSSRVVRIVETVAVGAVLALAAFLAFGDVPSVEQWKAAAFFSTFGVLAIALKYQTSQTTQGTIGFLPFLSVGLVSPNIAALSAVVVSVAVGELFLRRPLLKMAFNVAQHTFAVACAIAVYRFLGGETALGATPGFVPLMALVATYFVVNKLAVSTVVSASQGVSTRAHWLKSIRGSFVYDVLSFPLILFFAVAYARLGPGWSAILALPMLGIRQLYQTVFALQKINEELLQLMVASIEARDPYTSGHSQRVARYARFIAGAGGLGAKAVERAETAALLHDVGKIHEEFAIILRKPGALTEEEFAVMKTHPARSAELVRKVTQFADLVPAILAHHEAWDGRGYPDKKAAKEIPLGARVIALADTIDAMSTTRPYRAALSLEQVRDEIRRESGRQFDPHLCQSLLSPATWREFAREIDSALDAHPESMLAQEEIVLGRTGEYASSARGQTVSGTP
jgi:HD superfamily phosphodiesterase